MDITFLSKCRLCGGKVEKDTVNVENWWGDTFAIVENVPAWVCSDCGEQYFDADTSDDGHWDSPGTSNLRIKAGFSY